MTGFFAAMRRRRMARLIDQLGSPHDDTAARAEARLIQHGETAVGPVLSLATHPDPRMRFRVVWVLGKSRLPDVFSAVLGLTEDPDPRVAYDAIMALGELGDPRAIQPLQELIALHAGHPDALDSAAAMALVKLGAEIEYSG